MKTVARVDDLTAAMVGGGRRRCAVRQVHRTVGGQCLSGLQSYIRKGIDEGAEVLAGGEGHPQGLEAGYS